MEADVGPIEIETAIWLIAGLEAERGKRRQFPIDAETTAHFAVTENRVIQLADSMSIAEIFVHAKIGLFDIRASVNSYLLRCFVLDPRGRQHGIEQPLTAQLPTNSRCRDDWIIALHVDAHAED